MTINSPDEMIERFGPAIEGLLEDSSIRHLWRLSFLVSFFIVPLYAQVSTRHKVNRQEVQILYCLTQNSGLLAKDIALVTGQPKNSISRAVSSLIEKNYLHRVTQKHDRRAKTLEMTNAGREIIDKILPFIHERQDAMRDVLTKSEQKEFDTLLNKIVHAMPNWIDSGLTRPMG